MALINALAPQMPPQNGRIVNIGSVAAFTGHVDLWYGAAKAALLNITKSYASHLGPDGVLVNAVAQARPVPPCTSNCLSHARRLSCRSVYLNGTIIDVNNGSYPR